MGRNLGKSRPRFQISELTYLNLFPAQTHRLVPWLNRELNALMEAQIHQVPYVLQLILDLIQRFNIQSPEFHEQMMPYTGTRTNHFQHEFYNFARSTYDMIGYDRHAMYTDIHPMNPVTYVVSSDSSSSSSDENDIQVEQTSSTYSSASQQNQDNNELIVVDDSTPQTTTSADQKNNGANEEPVASTSSGQTIQNDETPFPLIISSGESDINESNKDNDVEIVNYVKPRKDRTPVIVNIDSSDDDKIKKEKVTSSTSAYNSLPSKSEESSTHSAFTSSLIALSPPASTTSPAIVVIDDSSPENRNVESEYRANRSDKPLWMRNFENCFPNAAETSDKIKKSKCQNEPTRKKLKSNKTRKRFSSPASSSTDSDVDQPNLKKRSKLQTPRNNKKDVRDIRKTISSPLNSSESSSTLGEDDGGWFQSGDNSDNTANCRKMNKKEDKGKGKGKGKSSQTRNEQEVDKAGCSNMRLELKLNQKNVKSINSEEKVCEKNGRRNLIDSNTDSEDRPLTHKRRRDVKHRRKGNENNLIKHVKQSVFNDRNKDDYNSKDMSLKQSKSRIRDSVQITTNTKVSDDFSSTKMAQEMENWKNANGIQKEFSANDRRDLKSAKAKGDKSITSREETSVETDPIVKKSLKRATNIFDSDSSNSVSSDETKNNSKHEEQLIQISSVKRKDYFLKKNLIHKTRKSKVLSSSSDDDVSSQTLLKCKERDSSVRLKHKCKSKRKDTNKIHDSNNTSPSVKSMVVKIDSNKVIKECVGGAITTSGQIDSDAISEDLRIKLNQKKKQKAKNLVKGNTNKGNFIEQRSIRLPTNDNDGQVNNPERILITSTLNNENCENVNERIVTVEHLPNLEEN